MRPLSASVAPRSIACWRRRRDVSSGTLCRLHGATRRPARAGRGRATSRSHRRDQQGVVCQPHSGSGAREAADRCHPTVKMGGVTVHRGWCRSWYNGWPPEQRQATIPIQRAAFRQGLIARPAFCSICGFDRPATPGSITLHLENYAVPLEGYGCCRRCHQAVHGRFGGPERWMRFLDRAGHTGWARNLTLCPQSQWQPFALSYPENLPSA